LGVRPAKAPLSVGESPTRRPPRPEVIGSVIEKWLKPPVWKRSDGRAIEAPPDERGGERWVEPWTTAPV
jgi:hypothetical protein